jgi:2-C-methyl-D-erythritol 4-phosphate cytidylyltransferase
VSVVAVVLGAGRGNRLEADAPKALVRVGGRTLLESSASAWPGPAQLLEPVTGGATRQESVARALESLAAGPLAVEWVLVHDAARCFVEPGDAERVLEVARRSGAAIPVVPVGETVKEVTGETVVRTLDRERLALAQTPQAFQVGLLREALEKAARDGVAGTDCASLVERLGARVATCSGRRENWKVTHPEDLVRAEALLREAAR